MFDLLFLLRYNSFHRNAIKLRNLTFQELRAMHSEIDLMKAKIAEAKRRKERHEAMLQRRQRAKIYEEITERKFKGLVEEEKAAKADASYRRTKMLLSSFALVMAALFTFNVTKDLAGELFHHLATKKAPFQELARADASFEEAVKYLDVLFGRAAANETYRPGSAWRADVPEAIAGETEEALKSVYGRRFEVLSMNANPDGGYYFASCKFQGLGNLSVSFRRSPRGFMLSSLEYL